MTGTGRRPRHRPGFGRVGKETARFGIPVHLSVALAVTLVMMPALATGGDFCDRTVQVQVAVLQLLPEAERCSDVSDDDLATIRFLDLSGKNITRLKNDDFARLASLVELDLRDNRLAVLSPGVFSNLPNLSRLRLDDNRIHRLKLGAFSDLPSLRKLGLRGNRLFRLPTISFMEVPRLVELDVRGNPLVSIAPGLFRTLPSLRVLGVNEKLLRKVHGRVLRSLRALKLERGRAEISVAVSDASLEPIVPVPAVRKPKKSFTKLRFKGYPTRVFAAADQYLASEFAAYGIVAFTSAATESSHERYVAICEAYRASIRSSWELLREGVSTRSEMVTVWPVREGEHAYRLNSDLSGHGERCDRVVRRIDMSASENAIRKAREQTGATLRGAGPYLLAWSPSRKLLEPRARVLALDLSDVRDTGQAERMFRLWKEEIMEDPDVWGRFWNSRRIRAKIMLFADRWGPGVLRWLG